MTFKIAHVQWLDSEGVNEWTPVDEVSNELDITHSVGLVIKECETFVLLSLSYDPSTASIHCHKKIPRLAIKHMRTVGRVKLG